jgi:hypothetical protein
MKDAKLVIAWGDAVHAESAGRVDACLAVSARDRDDRSNQWPAVDAVDDDAGERGVWRCRSLLLRPEARREEKSQKSRHPGT